MTTEELEPYGMREMDDDDIQQTLANESVGILGLSTDAAPILRPLSYWFDGESALYFVYVLGSESRKVAFSDQVDIARFLVYSIETPFNWQSVLLTGTIEEVPDAEQDALEAEMDVAWKPELFERASGPESTTLYRFEIEEQTGIKQLERPIDDGL